MKSVKATALTDAVIFTGEAFVENHALLLRGGRVLDIVRDNRIPADAEVVSHNGRIIAPAFVDCQVNGGGGALLNNSPTVETALTIAKAHAAHGTARLLLTCVSDTPEVMRSAANAAREARKQCDGILGIHFEGPHLGHERRGVHKAEYLRGMTAEDMDLYRPRGDEIVLVTVAPERVSADEIARLAGQGTKVSLGHTAADSSAIRAALKAGASCFTHLFNGMGGLAAREVTPATVALDDRDSWCGIIADGYHVSPETLRLAVRAKPAGKLFLVSDAMPPAGLETGRGGDFTLYGEAIHGDGKRCLTSDNRLAGSSATLADCVRYCITQAGIDPAEALRMASTYPAEFLGLGDGLGKLLPDYSANFAVLDVSALVAAR